MSKADLVNVMWSIVIVAMLAAHLVWKSQRLKRISLCEVAFWVSCLFFGVGPFVALANSDYGLPAFPAIAIHRAYLSVVLFLATLLVVHAVFRNRQADYGMATYTLTPAESPFSAIQGYALTVPSLHVLIVYGLFVGTHLILLLKYGLGTYGSARVEVLDNVPYHIMILRSLSSTVFRTAIEFWAFSSLWRRSRVSLALLVLLTSAIFTVVQTSRGQVISFSLIASLTYLVARERLGVKPILFGALSFVLVFYLLLPELWLFRTAWTATSGTSTKERAWYAWEVYRSGIDRESAMRRQQDNLARRPYIIGFNLTIADAQEQNTLLYGRTLGSSVLSVIPSGVYSLIGQQKRFFSSEAYAMNHYVGNMGDTSSNWPGTLAADFGVAGGIIAGLLLGGLLTLAERVALRVARARAVHAFLILGAFISVAIGVEVLIESGWMAVRDSIIAIALTTPLLTFVGTERIGYQPRVT